MGVCYVQFVETVLASDFPGILPFSLVMYMRNIPVEVGVKQTRADVVSKEGCMREEPPRL